MKKLILFIAAISFCSIATFADSKTQTPPPSVKVEKRPIILSRVPSNGTKINRAPAMPMYGNFDGETLTVDIRGAEDNEILTVYFHCANSVEQQNCTAAELRQGITVTVDSHFWLEIVTESGVVYKEHNETQED